MKNSFYKDIIINGTIGYAYQKLEFNKFKKFYDLEIIDSNQSFKEIFNEDISDKSLASSYVSDFCSYYGPLKKCIEEAGFSSLSKADDYRNYKSSFEFYSKKLHKTFNCVLYFRKPKHLVTVVRLVEGINDPLLDNTGKYKMIVENMNDCIWIQDEKLNFTYVSPSSHKIFGYLDDEMVKINVKKILTRESYRKTLLIYKEELANEQKASVDISRTRTFELDHVLSNKEIRTIEHVVQFIRGSKGNFAGVMGIARDITQWKEAKKEIEEAKESLELILNSTGEGIIGVDINGNCTFCNTSFLKIFSFSDKSEFIGKSFRTLIVNETMTEDNGIYNFLNTFSKREFRRNDGSTFTGEFFQYPQYKDGVLVGVVISFIDSTNLIRVENELKEIERSKAVLIKNIPGLVYRCKFDEAWTMEFVSDGSSILTGYCSDDFINNSKIAFVDIIDEEFREHLWNAWVNAKNTKQVFIQEYRITTKDNKKKWVLEQGQVIFNRYGEVEALEGLIIDITEQIRRQEQIEYLSYHDNLTGLFNRIYFDSEVSKYDKDKYYPLSVILGDINGLKILNDAVGHLEGDKLIIATARLLESCLTDREILARVGGDEFAILLPNTSSDDAYLKLLDIQKKIYNYNSNNPASNYSINISLGYGTKEDETVDFSKIQKIAEDKMYKRKLLERDSSHSSIISSIKATMFAKSEETEEHAERLRNLTILFGEKINLTQDQLAELSLLATLHDIGKVGIDEKILNKNGPLDDLEWIEMRKHSEIGYRIAIASPDIKSLANKILHHHEKWNGTGYPKGLVGKEIPMLSRIIAITDAYDAMTNNRPYRKALTREAALAEIRKCAGSQFDPILANKFLKFMKEDSDFFNY
jgi:diguanylate cyclase (GGDEF)-like protein/PAS domain S-box-containing protein